MEQKIIYSGETRALSDLDCPDGDLSLSLNMISENGALRPIILPDGEFTMNDGETLVFIHSTAEYKNYIYQTDGKLEAFTFQNNERIKLEFNYQLSGNLIQIQTIGNTLIILEDTRMQYALFKDNAYKVLGVKPPETSISFGLTGDVVRSDRFKVDIYTEKADGIGDIFRRLTTTGFSETNKTRIFQTLAARINKFIAEEVRGKGKFIYPFFIRYAYRMYDGSLTMYSAPILMTPTTDISPRVRIQETDRDSGGEREVFGFWSYVWAVVCELDCLIKNNSEQLKDWKDIITSIDFFISAPIYTYDQNGTEVKKLSYIQDQGDEQSFVKDAYCYCQLNQPKDRHIPNMSYTKIDAYTAYALYFWQMNPDGTYTITDNDFGNTEFDLPNNIENLHDKITSESLFYKVQSIKIDDMIYDTRQKMEIKSPVLQTLQVQEHMTDDYDSHDTILPSYLHTYNSRLNMCNLSKKLFEGFPVPAMTQFLQRDRYSYTGYVGLPDNFDAFVFIKQDAGSDLIVYVGYINILISNNLLYLSYPNPKAYRIVVRKQTTGKCASLSMKAHTMLNIAYYFGSFADITFDGTEAPVPSDNASIELPNKIYTSELGNPFNFPLSGINTVGVGRILGMSSTTQALSQGQFGQFPLLVFSTDGIWAMEVSATGLYSTKQPISRDVCSNPASITQTDGAVVFISDRGAMIINGSQVSCFSTVLDGPSFDIESVVKLNEIAAKENLLAELEAIMPIKNFLAECQIAFDYPNSRLYFIHESKPYAMVYSLASGTWAKTSSLFRQIINDYPNCYIQDEAGRVINISRKIDYDSPKVANGLILSRPLKLGDNELKTVTEIINRGIFEKNDVAMVLFASVDGKTYFPIGSVTGPKLYRISGTPYRYFRIGLIAKLSLQKSISGTSVYFEPKARNRPR